MILIIDFGSQVTHLISRRVKESGARVKIVSPEAAFAEIKKDKPKGVILSGGPSSVYAKNAPTIDSKIFNFNTPVLAICYGHQLMSKLLGGKVIPGKKEYGPATLEFRIQTSESRITNGLPQKFTVWMSHGDEVVSMPKNFQLLGSTDHVKISFIADEKRKIYSLQYHPEVEHTEFGTQILKNFIEICEVEIRKHEINIKKIKNEIKKTVGKSYVIGAVSGGVDSTVAGILAAEAIGDRFIPVYVENGLMREGTKEHVKKIFKNHHVKPIIVRVEKEMLKRLKGVSDPEQKRKIIGNFYIEIFEKEMLKLIKEGKDIKFLLQGTIYSDVIESGAPRRPDQQKDKGTKNADKIKSHHNVGGLPKNMKLKLLEPVRFFYKDEVRLIGKKIGLPDEFVQKQVFPGPGYAVRIRGEITRQRLQKIKQADKIVLEELEKAGILENLYMSFPIMTGAKSVSVKGDGRFFGEVIALRVVESKDVMTATWSKLPYDVLQKISSRIVNEVPGISRVVYDITTKPPATMEWE